MKTQVLFDTYPVNESMDPSGGYMMRIKEQPIVDETQVFEETVKEKTLPFSPDLLEFAFRSILTTMALKVSKDCRPRRIGNYLKAAPYLRGKVPGPFSPYDPETCSCAIVFTSLSGLTKSVNTTEFIQFVNSKTGTKVTISHITYEGDASEVGVIMKGKGIIVTGLNCQWLDGDSCTLAWEDAEGNPQTASITPTASSVTEMKFAWPTALNGVAAGTEVTFNFLTRGGVAESDSQPNTKTVTVLAGDTPTTPTTVTKVTQAGRTDDTVKLSKTEAATVHGTGLALGANDKVLIELYKEGVCVDEGDLTAAGKVVSSSDTAIELSGFAWNNRTVPDGDWWNAYPDSKLIVVKNGERVVHPLTFVGE